MLGITTSRKGRSGGTKVSGTEILESTCSVMVFLEPHSSNLDSETETLESTCAAMAFLEPHSPHLDSETEVLESTCSAMAFLEPYSPNLDSLIRAFNGQDMV